jgi:hypothetical protein
MRHFRIGYLSADDRGDAIVLHSREITAIVKLPSILVISAKAGIVAQVYRDRDLRGSGQAGPEGRWITGRPYQESLADGAVIRLAIGHRIGVQPRPGGYCSTIA